MQKLIKLIVRSRDCRDVIKRDVEIENLSTKCKKLQKRFEDTSTLTAEHRSECIVLSANTTKS